MLKVAVLDDYQNVFSQIINLDEYKSKYEFTVFNEPFQNELETIDNERKDKNYKNSYFKFTQVKIYNDFRN